MTPSSGAQVRAPKQERSRQSFDRAIDAATSLMVERRSGAFTLAEVAARSGVSVGSIYARVSSKEDLIRVAHARLMQRLSDSTTRAFAQQADLDASLREVVGCAVGVLAELLRENAPAMSPFMRVAHRDPVIADAGRKAHEDMVAAFRTLLLTAGPAIRRPDRERAVSWSCTVVYSVLARQLGLGSDPDAAVEHPWDELVDDLTELVAAYLAGPPSGASGSPMAPITN
jgi:AcrR family transcriptional regulator